MGVRGWQSGEWDSIPLAEKGRTWNAFQNWDEMAPLVAAAPNNRETRIPSKPFMITGSERMLSMDMVSVSSGWEKPKDFKRVRSNSV